MNPNNVMGPLVYPQVYKELWLKTRFNMHATTASTQPRELHRCIAVIFLRLMSAIHSILITCIPTFRTIYCIVVLMSVYCLTIFKLFSKENETSIRKEDVFPTYPFEFIREVKTSDAARTIICVIYRENVIEKGIAKKRFSGIE